jgi:hypothetical protein
VASRGEVSHDSSCGTSVPGCSSWPRARGYAAFQASRLVFITRRAAQSEMSSDSLGHPKGAPKVRQRHFSPFLPRHGRDGCRPEEAGDGGNSITSLGRHRVDRAWTAPNTSWTQAGRRRGRWIRERPGRLRTLGAAWLRTWARSPERNCASWCRLTRRKHHQRRVPQRHGGRGKRCGPSPLGTTASS